MTHYDTLGVAKDADPAAIRRAYRKKASRAHTDRVGGDHQAMVAVNRAYETLSDPAKRARYDATGEDRPQPSADQRAQELVMQLFLQVTDQLPEGSNLLSATRRQVRNNQSKAQGQKSQLQALLGRLERQRKQLKRKTEGRNFLDDLLTSRIAAGNEGLKSLDETMALNERALALLDEYEWTGAQTMFTTSASTTTYSGIFGR